MLSQLAFTSYFILTLNKKCLSIHLLMYMTILACIESNDTSKSYLKKKYIIACEISAHSQFFAWYLLRKMLKQHLLQWQYTIQRHWCLSLCTLNNRHGRNRVPKKARVLPHTLKDHCTVVLHQPDLLWRRQDRKNEYEPCLFTTTLFPITSKQKAAANPY